MRRPCHLGQPRVELEPAAIGVRQVVVLQGDRPEFRQPSEHAPRVRVEQRREAVAIEVQGPKVGQMPEGRARCGEGCERVGELT